ncbi:DUF7146 domain-containing protein [Methylobacterium platani]|uniref:Uncharacterized protein n=1 Tax=Methylobacterium platani TaxID=427683 RepID=A0A179SDT5_9HYPH|nr:toprim domain-containing protein [Methylobacterium platani]OAS25983.1 hypothetical protein A5481_07410 [Methylobacterium platani]
MMVAPADLLDIRTIAHALQGEIVGRDRALVPGPGHSRTDRSLSVWIDPTAPEGYRVHSFASDPFEECRDYVRDAVGLPAWQGSERISVDPAEIARRRAAREEARAAAEAEVLSKRQRALRIWNAAHDPRGTLVELYLRKRGLELPDDVAGEVLRFHPICPWAGETVPAMIALFRDAHTDEPTGIHRTALAQDGRKRFQGAEARKMYGGAIGAAIKLDPEAEITHGLAIGEGIETGLAARQLGIRPVWSLGSVGAIGVFPTLSGIEALTILGESDRKGANAAAIQACGTRWAEAGRAVDVVRPRGAGDMNDVVLECVSGCR